VVEHGHQHVLLGIGAHTQQVVLAEVHSPCYLEILAPGCLLACSSLAWVHSSGKWQANESQRHVAKPGREAEKRLAHVKYISRTSQNEPVHSAVLRGVEASTPRRTVSDACPSVKASPNNGACRARLGQIHHRPSRALHSSAVGPDLPRTLGATNAAPRYSRRASKEPSWDRAARARPSR
jgi:hypothetical protein